MSDQTGHTNTLYLDIPADHRYVSVLVVALAEVLDRAGFAATQQDVYNVQLAVQEACTNIVDHAYGSRPDGRIQATFILESEAQRLTVWLVDTGKGFDPHDVPQPMLDTPQIHGYGLYLMEQLMDDVDYESGPDQNRWCLVKQFA
jgi:serine/threonine-protein kinase RsbW